MCVRPFFGMPQAGCIFERSNVTCHSPASKPAGLAHKQVLTLAATANFVKAMIAAAVQWHGSSMAWQLWR